MCWLLTDFQNKSASRNKTGGLPEDVFRKPIDFYNISLGSFVQATALESPQEHSKADDRQVSINKANNVNANITVSGFYFTLYDIV